MGTYRVGKTKVKAKAVFESPIEVVIDTSKVNKRRETPKKCHGWVLDGGGKNKGWLLFGGDKPYGTWQKIEFPDKQMIKWKFGSILPLKNVSSIKIHGVAVQGSAIDRETTIAMVFKSGRVVKILPRKLDFADWFCHLHAMIPARAQITAERDLSKVHGIIRSKGKNLVSFVVTKHNKYLITNSKHKGAFGKFRFAMDLKKKKLFGLKVLRHTEVPDEKRLEKKTAYTKNKEMEKEIKIIKYCQPKIKVLDQSTVGEGAYKKSYVFMSAFPCTVSIFRFKYKHVLTGGFFQGREITRDGYFLSDLKSIVKLMIFADRIPIARRLVLDIANDLKTLHEKHWVHCDVKPDNLFIDKNGVGVLADYGNSVKAGEDSAGTALWCPKENRYGRIYKAKSSTDIYSLGLVWYFILTGRTPPPSYSDSSDDNCSHEIITEELKRAVEQSHSKKDLHINDLCFENKDDCTDFCFLWAYGIKMRMKKEEMNLLRRCLDPDEANRPKAGDIVKLLPRSKRGRNVITKETPDFRGAVKGLKEIKQELLLARRKLQRTSNRLFNF